nr:MAG TPA: holin [Caudoviricetes sp.]
MIQKISDMATYFSSLGLDRSIAAIGSLAGAVWGFAFTEAIWPLVWWLAIFVVIDFVTGWVAATKTGGFDSRILRDGVLRKVLIISVCGLSHGLDVLFEPVIGVSIFQTMVICMYGLGEFASILENLEKAGYGQSIPPILRRLIGALNHRLEDTVEKIEGDTNADTRPPKQ